MLGEDEGRNPVGAPGGVGDGGDDEDLPHAGVGDEDLGAVEHVVVAVVHGDGLGAAG
ncbi:MAG: hypothetical protein HW396_1167, partial [Candidatus Dadabacteria bacterium]|nr:hypothetical protein [Candidatus Dadabacteria bacterium]